MWTGTRVIGCCVVVPTKRRDRLAQGPKHPVRERHMQVFGLRVGRVPYFSTFICENAFIIFLSFFIPTGCVISDDVY